MDYDLSSEDGIYYEYARVLAAIGSAIVNWQNLEDELGRISRLSLDVKNGLGFGDAFYSIINFRDKLNFVDASVNRAVFADDEHLKKWAKIKHKISKASRKRNFLAHSHLMRHHKVKEGDKFVDAKPGERYKLGPSFMQSKRIEEAFNSPKKSWKTLRQIEDIDNSFKKLLVDLTAFHQRLQELKERHEASPQ